MLSACAGGGAGTPGTPGVSGAAAAALSAPAGRDAARAQARRELAQPTCSGTGTGSFIGINTGSDADGGYSVVTGGLIDDACGYATTVGGGEYNGVDSLSSYGAIDGGDRNGIADAFEGTIAGGGSNVVTGADGAIGGGASNGASGTYGTIGGGFNSRASGAFGTVAGGESNQASGQYAMVPGGQGNVAHGEGSFAAGMGSNANDNGDFVWSDVASGATPISVTGDNEFLARARGGVTFYSSANLKSGVSLAPGSGTWSSLSDRNAKTGIVAVSDDGILAKVAALPISEWSYSTERGVRHVGPMAQDFYAAFNVGEDDRHITSIDEDGVALAAVKALDARQMALKTELAGKNAAIRALQLEDARLQRRVAKLEAGFEALRAASKPGSGAR